MFSNTKFFIFADQGLLTTLAQPGSGTILYRDFINDPQLNGPISSYRIGPNLQFLRNSNATFFNSLCVLETAGINVPRFEYTPTGTLKGLLVEKSTTNYIPYSNNFQHTSWFKPLTAGTSNPGVTFVTNVPGISAPDNTQTVTRMTNTSAYGYHIMSWGELPVPQISAIELSQIYDRSIFVKRDTARYLCISVSPTPSAESITSIFDFDTLGFSESTLNPYVIPINNGWYRLGFNRLTTNSNTNRFTIGIAKGPEWTDSTFETDQLDLSSVYLWGAQAEVGVYPTSYIPTNGTEVTRDGDDVGITGKNFATFYNLSGSSFYIKSSKIQNVDYTGLITYFSAISSVFWQPEQTPIYRQLLKENNIPTNTFATFTNNILTKYWTIGSVLSGEINSLANTSMISSINTSIITGDSFTFAAGLTANDFVLYENQNLIGTVESGNLPSAPVAPVQFQLGRFGISKYLDGHIQEFGYWPTRLSNQQLSAL